MQLWLDCASEGERALEAADAIAQVMSWSVKVIDPSRLLAKAAEVLAEVRHDVVVVGAAALEVALASDSSVVITPTRDIDLVIPVERAAAIVAHLEAVHMHRSELDDAPRLRAVEAIVQARRSSSTNVVEHALGYAPT